MLIGLTKGVDKNKRRLKSKLGAKKKDSGSLDEEKKGAG